MNSAKSNDFMSPRGAPAILLSCAQGANPLPKNTTRSTCAYRRVRRISQTGFLNFCARGLPLQPYQHHRDHLPHRQMVISIVNVFATIDAVVAVPSSSSTSPSLVPSSSSSQTSPTSSRHRARPSIVAMLTFIIDARRRSLALMIPSSTPSSIAPRPLAS